MHFCAHQKVRFSYCQTGRVHESRVSTCVCGQERELIMLSARPVRVGAPDRNMGKQLWHSRLRVDDEAEQLIDFKHRKWEFPIMTKVCDAKCVYLCACVCSVHDI